MCETRPAPGPPRTIREYTFNRDMHELRRLIIKGLPRSQDYISNHGHFTVQNKRQWADPEAKFLKDVDGPARRQLMQGTLEIVSAEDSIKRQGVSAADTRGGNTVAQGTERGMTLTRTRGPRWLGAGGNGSG